MKRSSFLKSLFGIPLAFKALTEVSNKKYPVEISVKKLNVEEFCHDCETIKCTGQPCAPGETCIEPYFQYKAGVFSTQGPVV